MNAKIDYPMSVTNTLKTEIYTMAFNPQEYVINPGKDFTRKRKLDFANVLLFLIIMGNSNTDYELVKYFEEIYCSVSKRLSKQKSSTSMLLFSFISAIVQSGSSASGTLRNHF